MSDIFDRMKGVSEKPTAYAVAESEVYPRVMIVSREGVACMRVVLFEEGGRYYTAGSICSLEHLDLLPGSRLDYWLKAEEIESEIEKPILELTFDELLLIAAEKHDTKVDLIRVKMR